MDKNLSREALESAVRHGGSQSWVILGSIQLIGLSGVREKLAGRWQEWSAAVYGLIETAFRNQFGETASFLRSDDETYTLILAETDFTAARSAIESVAGKIQAWLTSAMPVSQTVVIRFHAARISKSAAIEACASATELQRLVEQTSETQNPSQRNLPIHLSDRAQNDKRSNSIVYGSSDIDNVLSHMRTEEIDRLPFGVIKMDRQGKILVYNVAEAAISGRDRFEVIGRNFFKEIAPCTNRPEFLGRFAEGLKSGLLDVKFHYLFDSR